MTDSPFSFAEELRKLAEPHLSRTPERWDIWKWFTDELPVYWYTPQAGQRSKREAAWIRGDEHKPNTMLGLQEPPLPIRTSAGPDKKGVGLSPCITVAAPSGRFGVAMCRSKRWGKFCLPAPCEGFVDAHKLWSLRRNELIEYMTTCDESEFLGELRGLIREVLGLKEPTWGKNYFQLRSRTWVRRGELVSATFRETEPPVPCVVISDPAVTGLTTDVVVLRTIKYKAVHEEPMRTGFGAPLSVYPITLPNGRQRSVALPLMRSLSVGAIRPWTPKSHDLGDDMTIIDQRLEDIFGTSHS